jgi:hypothetical protein
MSVKEANNNPGMCRVRHNPVFVVRLGPEISFRACLWVLLEPRHIAKCRLSTQRFIFLLILCVEIPRDGSGPTNVWREPPLASLSAISFPRTPACPGTQYSPTVCRVEIFNVFWHCRTNGDVLAAWRAFRAAWLSEKILTYPSVPHERSPNWCPWDSWSDVLVQSPLKWKECVCGPTGKVQKKPPWL